MAFFSLTIQHILHGIRTLPWTISHFYSIDLCFENKKSLILKTYPNLNSKSRKSATQIQDSR